MCSKKLFVSTLVLFFLFGRLALSGAGHGAGFDPTIADYDRLIDSMLKTGQITASARAEQEQQLKAILSKRFQARATLNNKNYFKNPGELKREQHIRNQIAKIRAQGALAMLPSPLLSSADSPTRTDKVLVLLVEFADYDHKQITPEMTDLFFADYSPEHYKGLLFSPSGFAGPNGQRLMSMSEYYMAQSGNSYNVAGDVFGWFKVSQPAAYYGANSSTRGGNDSNPRELVKEAFTRKTRAELEDLFSDIDLPEY